MNAKANMGKQCERFGWVYKTDGHLERIEGPDVQLTWFDTDAEQGVFSPHYHGHQTGFRNAMNLWTRYMQEVCKEKGWSGVWMEEWIEVDFGDRESAIIEVTPELCPGVMTIPNPGVPEKNWTVAITQWAYLPSGAKGEKVVDLWKSLLPLLFDIQKEQKTNDPLFHFCSPHRMDVQNHSLQACRAMMRIHYFTKGAYHSFILDLKEEPCIQCKKKTSLPQDANELKALITEEIQDVQRAGKLKHLLSPPRKRYDAAIDSTHRLRGEVSEQFYHYLLPIYGPEYIEVWSKEIGFYGYSRNLNEEFYCVGSTFLVTTRTMKNPDILYMGESAEEAVECSLSLSLSDKEGVKRMLEGEAYRKRKRLNQIMA